MLKEYRVCMPMTVDEYQIGQLYMIARHSAEQSDGGEGVEVIENRPHVDPELGSGQYTEKRIHLSSKLPVWIRSYIPKFIYVTEKAWNYYPYTITEYTCSVISSRFTVRIKTCYENNNGNSENCIRATEEELKQRIIDHVDILSDPVEEKHYKQQEDLSIFKSKKTGRGPLKEGWRDVADPIMCSYKMVDVSFQVFGLQTRVEDFVHRTIRSVLLLGHRQAFAWIDEWHGMTLADVREYETQMQHDTNARLRNAQQEAHLIPNGEEVDGVIASPAVTPGSRPNTPKNFRGLLSSPSHNSRSNPTTPDSPSATTNKSAGVSAWFKWT